MKEQLKDKVLDDCLNLFGDNNGKLLYRAMRRISTLGFEVCPTRDYDKVIVVDERKGKSKVFGLEGYGLEYIAVGETVRHIPDVTAAQIRGYINKS